MKNHSIDIYSKCGCHIASDWGPIKRVAVVHAMEWQGKMIHHTLELLQLLLGFFVVCMYVCGDGFPVCDAFTVSRHANMKSYIRSPLYKLHIQHHKQERRTHYASAVEGTIPSNKMSALTRWLRRQRTVTNSKSTAKQQHPTPNSKTAPSGGISVGIDLGTTYSAISILQPNRVPRIIPIDGRNIVPSVVAYRPNGEVLVGEEASKYLAADPLNTFASIKRFMGRTFGDIIDDKQHVNTVQANKFAANTYRLLDDRKKNSSNKHRTGSGHDGMDDDVLFSCPNTASGVVSPVEVSADIIKKLLREAKSALQVNHISNAVITVPAYFLPSQCRATEEAARLAGLYKVKLLREPEAVALAYGLPQTLQPQIVLVFDIGGGTLDISVLEVGKGLVEVIATTGDAYLGGDDFNEVIMDWLLSQIASRYGSAVKTTMTNDVAAMSSLLAEAERMKVELSSKRQVTTNISLDTGSVEQEKVHHVDLQSSILTRDQFERLCSPLCTRMLQPLREAALLAGVNLPGETCVPGVDDLSLYKGADSEDDNEEYERFHEDNDDESDVFEDSSTVKAYSQPQMDRRSGGMSRADRLAEYSIDDLKHWSLQAKTNKGKVRNRMRKQQKAQTKSLYQEKKRLGSMPAFSTAAVAGTSSKLSVFPGGQRIHRVILAGGASRMPLIGKFLKTLLGEDVLTSSSSKQAGAGSGGGSEGLKRYVHPDECVCAGAAVMCGVLDGKITDMNVVNSWQASIYRALAQMNEQAGNIEDEDADDDDDDDEVDDG
jgi:molecular chaperone DnaK (HSP70)